MPLLDRGVCQSVPVLGILVLAEISVVVPGVSAGRSESVGLKL